MCDDVCRDILEPAFAATPRRGFRYAQVVRSWEAGYRAVNARLAGALAEAWHERPVPIMLYGGELFGCGSILRNLLPYARIGHLCTSRFPDIQALRALPHLLVSDILDSLLACDLVGFQTYADVTAFIRACSRLTGTRVQDDGVVRRGRQVRLGLFPVPTSPDAGAAFVVTAVPSAHGIVSAGVGAPMEDPYGALAALVRVVGQDVSSRGRIRVVVLAGAGPGLAGRDALAAAVSALNARVAQSRWAAAPVELVDDEGQQGARADVVLVAGMNERGPMLDEIPRIARRGKGLVVAVSRGALALGVPGPTDLCAAATPLPGPLKAESWLADQLIALTKISQPPVRLAWPAPHRNGDGGTDVMDS
ncbi:MAG: trehalose-6-phosphate synthase [Actinomycetota bacterium]